jgi:hypothetical protein
MTTLEHTDRPTRIVLVTAGLCATGGLVGAVSAASVVATLAIHSGGVHALTSGGTPGLLAVAAGFGAFCGIIGGPLLAWGLLRRVPLGRVILYTAAGTILGAIGGQLLQPVNPFAQTVPGVLAGAFLGFVSAGIGLRVHSRLTQATSVDGAV